MSDTGYACASRLQRRIFGRVFVLLWMCAIVAVIQPVGAQSIPIPPIQARIIVQSGHAAEISAAAWTSDGRFLLTGSSDAQILVWDLRGRIVNRISVGDANRRTVVEAIRTLPGNQGAEVDIIWFKDMFDNGVGSEVWRTRHRLSFADGQAPEIASDVAGLGWDAAPDFLARSLALKKSLTGRRDWPRSSLGWTLAQRAGVLVMIAPGQASAPVALNGVLGADNDGGEARLEAAARRLELRANAMMSMMQSKKGETQPSAAMIDPSREIAAFAPKFAPDGAMLAWIDQGKTNRLMILDLERGSARASLDLGSGLGGKLGAQPLGWTDRSTLVTGLGGGQTVRIGRTATIASGVGDDCALNTSGELGIFCGGELTPPLNAGGQRRVDLRVDAASIVHATDSATGHYLCAAFLDETEVRGGDYLRASADNRWLTVQSGQGYTELFHLNDRMLEATTNCEPGSDCAKQTSDDLQLRQRQCPASAVLKTVPGRIGFHPTLPLLWIEGRQGSIAFYHLAAIRPGRDSEGLGSPLFTLYRLPKGQFFAIDAKGRYDTNMPPDTQTVRWNMPDAPFQSFAAQTFMRDYYQPGLMRRLMQCAQSGAVACDDRFPPIRPVASINRVLPVVELLEVLPGAEPSEAVVTVKVTEGVDMSATNGKTRSGLYGIRLFHNDRIVFSWPDPVQADVERRKAAARDPGARDPEPRRDWVADAMQKDIETWRALNRIEPDDLGEIPPFIFSVVVPSGDIGQKSVFSAYAFNEDRVKSDTAAMAWTIPPAPRRRPRAFIITIGIDAYDSPRLPLQFAAADAALMGERLAGIPNHEIRRITLEGRMSADGTPRRVTRDIIKRLFNAMMGTGTAEDARDAAPVREAVIRDLLAMGFDVSQLDALRPDDIVILTFSGHGWADKQGNFYLLPADAEWLEGSDEPNRDTLISATSLTEYLSYWPAKEITFIIDACHSAGSVGSADFKPGPMGDAGLGQLAYDKGIRILAATQADDVAIEDASLKQGLLTYALAREGLGTSDGKADSDGDGRVTLEEWLSYAIWRMPSLGAEVRQGRTGVDANGLRGWIRTRATAPPPTQEPALFDFNSKPSGIIVKAGAAR